MMINKGKRCLALLICLLLVGCQKEATTEEQQIDLSDDAVTYEAENTENVEGDEGSGDNVTVISVLGKEELIIENSRLSGGELNNRFTPEEMDIILNAIQGSWEIDEYWGFTSRVDFEENIWDSADGELEDAYMNAMEEAHNVPEFIFTIYEYGVEVEDQVTNDMGKNHSIYVTNSNRRFASPINICLKINGGNDGYAEFLSRATEEYSIIYIDFFTFYYSEKDEKVIYEPVTLLLASDGTKMLIKDGAYYSIKNNVQGEIMAGNFQHLEEEDSDYREYIIKHITRNIRGESYPVEWRQIDLNGDGIDDLILQDRDSVGKSSQKRIIAIFACYEDSARCITLDLQDGTEYSFCGTTGELMHTAPSYGGVISTEQYEHYYYDSEWSKIADYTLQAYRINGSESDPIPEYWIEQNPSLATNGRYYRRYEGNYTQFVNSGTEGEWKGETLTFQEFKEAYETVMGDEFYSDYFHE